MSFVLFQVSQCLSHLGHLFVARAESAVLGPTTDDLVSWWKIGPTKPEGWKRAFHTLIKHSFKDDIPVAEKHEKVAQVIASPSRRQTVRSRLTRDLVMALSAIRMGRTPIEGADET